jgi:hypothetical protein
VEIYKNTQSKLQSERKDLPIFTSDLENIIHEHHPKIVDTLVTNAQMFIVISIRQVNNNS